MSKRKLPGKRQLRIVDGSYRPRRGTARGFANGLVPPAKLSKREREL